MPDYYQEYIICRYSYFYDATKIISDVKIEFIHQQSPGKKVYLSGKKKKKNKKNARVATEQEFDFFGLDMLWRKFLSDRM